jgi:hypothetical protein
MHDCRPRSRSAASERVTKFAIDRRPRESENKGNEETWAGVLPASGRLRGQEAAGCRDPGSNSEPVAAGYRRNHRALCNHQAGKCQHRDLQLSAHDHRDRFKNRAHQAGLQENERGKRGKIKPGPGLWGPNLSSPSAALNRSITRCLGLPILHWPDRRPGLKQKRLPRDFFHSS